MVKYVVKDGSFVCEGIPDMVAWLDDKKGKTGALKQVAKMVVDGKGMRAIAEAFPSTTMLHQKKIKAFMALTAAFKDEDSKKEWIPLVDPEDREDEEEQDDVWDGATRKIAAWCNLAAAGPFKHGEKHLFLYGPTGVGKTSLVRWLELFFCVYWMPIDEDFYDFYDDARTQFVCLDEFVGQKKLTWLNLFLGGAPMTMRAKGFQISKKLNMPTIIVSNKTLRECYSGVSEEHFATISRRLLKVKISGALPFVTMD